MGANNDAGRSADDLLIDALGGTVVVARLCQVKPSAVSQWRRDGIPRARLMFLELARPDVFDHVLREQPAAA